MTEYDLIVDLTYWRLASSYFKKRSFENIYQEYSSIDGNVLRIIPVLDEWIKQQGLPKPFFEKFNDSNQSKPVGTVKFGNEEYGYYPCVIYDASDSSFADDTLNMVFNYITVEIQKSVVVIQSIERPWCLGFITTGCLDEIRIFPWEESDKDKILGITNIPLDDECLTFNSETEHV